MGVPVLAAVAAWVGDDVPDGNGSVLAVGVGVVIAPPSMVTEPSSLDWSTFKPSE